MASSRPSSSASGGGGGVSKIPGLKSGLPVLSRGSSNLQPAAAADPSKSSAKSSPAASVSGVKDSGGVLTEDTDSFIIGDRVYVGGTKRGKIAFIGETKFAKGDWAGVVLDEPIGKNDGSVNGIRYFQCEPLHGTFTKLTRLTRHSLVPIDPSKDPCHVHGNTPPRCLLERQRSPSPYHSKSPSPGLGGSATPTRLGSPAPVVKIGERVIVQSSIGGTKKGLCRFIGTTEFAPGEWVGIELDNPVGKNDGAVNGTRYFQCRDKYGLFAPMQKVSSSPANRISGSFHLRKHGSRESMTSNLSSIASSATRSIRKPMPQSHRPMCLPTCSLQSVLKEKEKHLEQLLKERDMDSTDMAQINSQYKKSVQDLIQTKSELASFQEESLKEIGELKSKLETLQVREETLANGLEEERKKSEDILFSFEEMKILNSDLQSQLESKVTDSGASNLDENKAGGDNAEFVISNLKKELEELNKKLATNIELHNKEISSFKAELSLMNSTKKQIAEEKNALLEQQNTFKVKFEEINSVNAELRKKFEEKENELKNIMNSKAETSTLMSTKLRQKEEFEIETKKIHEKEKENLNELLLSEANQRLLFEKELQEKNLQIQESDKVKTQLSELNSKLAQKEKESEDLKKTLNSEKDSFLKQDEALRAEILSLQNSLINKDSSQSIESEKLKSQINEFEANLKVKENEIDKLKKALDSDKSSFMKQDESLKAEILSLQNSLKKNDSEMQASLKEFNLATNLLSQKEKEFTNLKAKYEESVNENSNYKENLEKISIEKNELIEANKTSQNELNKLNSNLDATSKEGLEKENKITMLQKSHVEILEKKERVLKTSEEELAKEKSKYAESEALIAKLKNTISEITNKMTANESEKVQVLNVKYEELNSENVALKGKFVEKENEFKISMNSKVEENRVLSSKLKEKEELETEMKKSHEKDKESLNQLLISEEKKKLELEKGLQEKISQISELTKVKSQAAETSKNLEQKEKEMVDMKSSFQKENSSIMEKNEALKAELISLQDLLKNKESSYSTEQSKLNSTLTEITNNLKQKENELVDLKKSLESDRASFKKQDEALRAEILSLQNSLINKDSSQSIESSKLKSQINEFEAGLKQKEDEIQELKKALDSDKGSFMKQDESLRNEILALQNSLEKAKSESQTSNNKFTSLVAEKEKEHAILKTKYDESVNEHLKFKEILEKISSEKNQLIEASKASQNELNELKLKLAATVKDGLEMEKQLTLLRQTHSEALKKKESGLKLNEDELAQEKLKNKENDALILKLKNSISEFTNKMTANESEHSSLIENMKKGLECKEKAFQTLETEHKKSIKDFQEQLLTATNSMKSKMSELTIAQNEMDVLKNTLNEKSASVEKLQMLLEKAEKSQEKLPESEEMAKLMNELSSKEIHINFLNSIIVDLQKKIEELNIKIDCLMSSGGKSESKPSPVALQKSLENYRLYCDICEEFDIHDTEDCPMQESQPSEESHHKGKRNEVRPYCDSCEVFGHWTNECDDGETF